MSRPTRIFRELKDEGRGAPVIFVGGGWEQDACGVLRPDDDDLQSWTAAMSGPTGTSYEHGIFVLSISLPADYPYSPPRVKFVTPIYHPNVLTSTGDIDLLLRAEKDYQWAVYFTSS